MRTLRTLMLGSLLLGAPALAAGPVGLVPTTGNAAHAIPEPAAFALFVLGAGVIGVAIRGRKN